MKRRLLVQISLSISMSEHIKKVVKKVSYFPTVAEPGVHLWRCRCFLSFFFLYILYMIKTIQPI
jgi:hypothetical protein